MLDIEVFIDTLKEDSGLSETSFNVFKYLYKLKFSSIKLIPVVINEENRLFIRMIKGYHSIDIHRSTISFIELRDEEDNEGEGFTIDFYTFKDKDEMELSDKLKEMLDHFLRFYMKMEVQ